MFAQTCLVVPAQLLRKASAMLPGSTVTGGETGVPRALRQASAEHMPCYKSRGAASVQLLVQNLLAADSLAADRPTGLRNLAARASLQPAHRQLCSQEGRSPGCKVSNGAS